MLKVIGGRGGTPAEPDAVVSSRSSQGAGEVGPTGYGFGRRASTDANHLEEAFRARLQRTAPGCTRRTSLTIFSSRTSTSQRRFCSISAPRTCEAGTRPLVALHEFADALDGGHLHVHDERTSVPLELLQDGLAVRRDDVVAMKSRVELAVDTERRLRACAAARRRSHWSYR